MAVVLLIPRTGPAWRIALYRFMEVSIGIAVALLLAAVWPEKEVAAEKKVNEQNGLWQARDAQHAAALQRI